MMAARKIFSITWLWVICMALLIGCELGGGTDVENASLRGKVMLEGEAVAFADLYLMSNVYNPMKPTEYPSFKTQTNEAGEFSFPNVKRDVYALEIRYQGKAVMDWMGNLNLEENPEANYQLDLKPAHTLLFSVPDSLQDSALYIFIPGCLAMGRLGASDDKTEISLSHVPETPIWAVYYGFENRPDFEPQPFYWDIPVPATDTVDLRD